MVQAVSAVFLSALVAALTASPAYADPWPWVDHDGNELAKPDLGEFHTFCLTGSFHATMKEKVHGSETYLNNATDVETSQQQTCAAKTDVVWEQEFVEEGVLGAT